MSAVYPTIADWDAFVASLTPSPSFIGVNGDFVTAFCKPWSEIEQAIETLTVGIVEPATAPMWVLGVLGARVDEPVGGLQPGEYLLVVEGRRYSAASTGSQVDVYATLLALTGATEGRYSVLDGADSASIALSAYMSAAPSPTFLIRAARILRDAIPLGTEGEAVIRVATTMVWGEGPAWGSGTWGYTLSLPLS